MVKFKCSWKFCNFTKSFIVAFVILGISYAEDPVEDKDKTNEGAVATARCPDGFDKIKDTCIKFFADPKTMDLARGICESPLELSLHNGTLLMINSTEDWASITEIAERKLSELKQMWATAWIGYLPKDKIPNATEYFCTHGDNSDQSMVIKVTESFWKDNHIKCDESTGESMDPTAPSEDRVANHGLALHFDVKEENGEAQISSMHWLRQDIYRPMPFFCMAHVLSPKATVKKNDTAVTEKPGDKPTDKPAEVTKPVTKGNATVTGKATMGSSTAKPTGSSSSTSTTSPDPGSLKNAQKDGKGKSKKGAGHGGTVAVIFIFLILAVLGGGGFVLYRKRMWPFGPGRGHSNFGTHSYSTDQL